MTGTDPDVLIVGAGPIGMVLACELLQQGVVIRLVDRQDRVDDADPHSKGILVWPRSLELLRRIGVSDRMIAAGHRSEGVDYYSEGRLLGTAHLHRHPDSPYSFVLTLPQRETECVLRARLAELGGVVERGVELVDLDTSGRLPVAKLRLADGTDEIVAPKYLVGADGPGSATRDLLGIGFDGDPLDVTYAIGDVPLTGNAPANAGYFYSRKGVVALVPMRDGVYRFAANIPHRTEAEGNPPKELLQQIINERAHIDVTVGEPLWTRSFRPRLGLAGRAREQRCFLVGDAAHVISPAGGQGMNIGFQDAANLGWKLGGVVRGLFDESILDSYEPERQAGAERMSRTSATQGRFALQRNTIRIMRRDAIFLAGRFLGVLQRVLVPMLSQTDVNYGRQDTRPIVLRRNGVAQPGQRVALFAPELNPYRYTVAAWPGTRTPAGWAGTVAAVRTAVGDTAEVLDLSGAEHRALVRSFGRRATFAIVRPDGHLAHRVTPPRAEDVADFLTTLAPAAESATATV